MSSTAQFSRQTRSAAIICFMPDYGHLQPLLRVADALAQAGYHIHCYIAAECAPLLRRFSFDTTFLEEMDLDKAKKALATTFARSIFFNRYSGYSALNVYYVPQIMRSASRSAEALKASLAAQQPDIVIADAHIFSEWYGRMAEAVGSPIIFNNNDGSLAGTKREFVRSYGLTDLAAPAQRAVELAGAASSRFYRAFYRLGRVQDARGAYAMKSSAKQAFDAVFPAPIAPKRVMGPICVGSARIERDFLSHVFGKTGVAEHAFNPIRFHLSSPMPDDLRAWMDAASDKPIVYASFGTIVELQKEFAVAVHEGLRRVNARVLWRIPDNQRLLLASLAPADNIRFESFVPQPEVLEHEAVCCFLTQGGAWGVQEAWFAGTPMVVTPFFADQPYNASVVARLGLGLRLWRSAVTAESIASSIGEVLNNKTYRDNAARLKTYLLANDGGKDVTAFVESAITCRPSAPVQDKAEAEAFEA